MSDWHPLEPTDLDELDGVLEIITSKKTSIAITLEELEFQNIVKKVENPIELRKHDELLGKKRPLSILETNITEQLKDAGIQ